MILSAWSLLITTFGMVRWEVCSEAASAAVDRPGVLAIASNVGASDCSSVRPLYPRDGIPRMPRARS